MPTKRRASDYEIWKYYQSASNGGAKKLQNLTVPHLATGMVQGILSEDDGRIAQWAWMGRGRRMPSIAWQVTNQRVPDWVWQHVLWACMSPLPHFETLKHYQSVCKMHGEVLQNLMVCQAETGHKEQTAPQKGLPKACLRAISKRQTGKVTLSLDTWGLLDES